MPANKKTLIDGDFQVGSNHLTVDTSNNYVGFNNATPQNKIDVQIGARTGTHSTDKPLYVTGVTSTSGAEFVSDDGTAGIGIGSSNIFTTETNQNLTITPDGTGAVGIKTATPNPSGETFDLWVQGDTKVTGNVTADHIFGDGSGLTNIISSQWDSSLEDIYFLNNSGSGSGRVAIGTTTPVSVLTLEGDSGGAPPTTGQEGTSNALVRIRDDNNVTLDIGTSSGKVWLQSSDATNMGTNYPVSMNPNGGNVGVGTISPGAPLEVSKSSGGEILRLTTSTGTLYAGADADPPWFGTSSNDHLRLMTNGTEKIRIESGGKVGVNTVTPLANLHVTGNTYVTSDLRVGSKIVMDEKVATFGDSKTFVVEVVGGAFQIDGVSRPALTFHERQTYIFDQSHSSNSGSPGHPIAFAEAVNGGTPYSTGVTTVGTPGQAGAQTIFKVPVGAPSTLFYYCVNHPTTMGSLSNAPSVVSTEAEVVVSGRVIASGNVEASSFKGESISSTRTLISNAATMGTTKTFVVTASGGAFYIDGVQQDSLELHEHQTYLFDLTAPGTTHPFRLATVANGGGGQPFSSLPGSDYITGTDYSSVANHLKFTVPPGAPSTLYYYCTQHTGMGGSMSVSSTAELIVSGRVVASGNVEASSFKGDGTELTGVALETELASNVLRIANLEAANTVQSNLITAIEADIVTLEAANTVQSNLITAIEADIVTLEAANTVQGNLITTLTTDMTSNALRVTNIENNVLVSNSSGITTGFTRGDIIYASADNTLNKLTLGTANQVLKSDGTDIVWGTGGGGTASTVWLENGNKIYYNTDNVGIGTSTPAFKLDVHGTANVGALTATTLSVGGAAVALDADMTSNAALIDALYTATTGDIIVATGTDTLGKLGIGSSGQVLKVASSGTSLEWTSDLTGGGGGGGGGQWTGTTEIYFEGNVGISNTDPGHDLSVGSNLYVDDDGSNVLVIDGNLTAESMTLGGIGIVPSYPLSSVTDTGNTTPHTIEFTNAETGLVVDSNIVVAGNVTAGFLYGDASNVTGITANLHQIVENGNVTSNTVQFSNATTGLVTTANVEVGGDLTVSGNVSDLNVVSNVNLLHTSNTASIKLNSNVVTCFDRSKKLIKYPRVAMTANDNSGTSGYVTNASTWENQANNETYGPWNNFNGILNDSAWQSTPRRFSQTTGDWDGTTTAPYAISLTSGTIYGEWVELKIPNKIQLHTCRISPLKSTTYPNLGKHRSPRDGYILGRVGATGNWTVLKSWSGLIGGWEDLVLRDFDIENPLEYYDYFRVVWTAINGNNNYSTSAGAGYASSGEIEFLGVPEYDPEADGVDVVVKSVPNVPNTDWLEVYYDAKNYTTGVVQDETANNRDGVLYGNTTLSSADGIHKFDFDGNGDYINTTLTGFTGKTVTFSAWVFMDSVDTSRPNTIMGLGSWGGNGSAAWIAVGSGGKLETGNKGIVSCVSPVQANTLTGRWLHITGIVSSGDFRFYQDGQLIKSLNTTGTINYGTNPVLYLATRANSSGNPESTRYFDCKIANARLFNRALTTDEVYQLYAYQKEYFGHGDLGMTLKAGNLHIDGFVGTSRTGGLIIPSGTTTQLPTGVIGMIRFNTDLNKLQLSNGSTWITVGGVSATGGTITNADGYTIHTFTGASGTFTVTAGGAIEYLVVAGGGGGGNAHGTNSVGGGGAGGMLTGTINAFASGSYTITVGAGGAGTSSNQTNGTNGSDSSISTLIVATGGGGGGAAANSNGLDGGSGGGAGTYTTSTVAQTGGSGISGQGNDGRSTTGVVGHGGGGGGGAGSAAPAIPTNGVGGAGGSGLASSISGTSTFYAGGGGGTGWEGTAAGSGGIGGGGAGGTRGSDGINGTANTGGGGGGCKNTHRSGDGGSGIVIIRYLT